jgi:DnaA regulatory inactivator Hda
MNTTALSDRLQVLPEWALWLRLSQTPGIGPKTLRQLLQTFGSVHAVLVQTPQALRQVLSQAQAEALQIEPADWLALCTRTQTWLAQTADGVEHAVWTWGDPQYPQGLLALDDVDAVPGNTALETALVHLWNGLLERGACVLLAARQPPAGVGIRLPDLASRFASSLVMQLQAPDDEELSEVLRVMADQRGLELGPGVAAFLLRRVRRDTHQLTVLMERLDAAALAAQRALTVPFVREVIGGG